MDYNVKEKKIKISCIHPTCRPSQAREIRKVWLERSKNRENIEYLTCYDTKNKDLFFAKKVIDANLIDYYHPESIGLVVKTNYLAKFTKGKCIILSTDDTVPEKNWDEAIFNSANWDSEVVLNTSDGSEEKERRHYIIKGLIVSKIRYQKLGYIFHPELEHLFCDDFHSWISYRDGVVLEKKGILLEHTHPSEGKSQWDKFYERVNTKEKYKLGGVKFMDLVQRNVDQKILDSLVDEYIVSDEKRKSKVKFVLEAAGFDFKSFE